MSDKNDNNLFDQQTSPITIPMSRGRRARSMSMSSSSSSGSASSSPEVPQTPPGARLSIPSPSTSPILSYFLSQSPTKTPQTGNSFPYRKFGTSPVFEEEEPEKEPPVAVHARRASATIAHRLNQPPSAFSTEAHAERATNLLRRLSLGAPALAKSFVESPTKASLPPSPPPNSAVTPTSSPPLVTKPRRSATISAPRRPPSPMGERILKGHFDGFN